MSDMIEEMMPLTLAKGCTMRIFIDHSKPIDDPDHNYTVASYDGAEDSLVFAVPRHWHDDHAEIMEVLCGQVGIEVNGKTTVLSAGDGPFLIPRGSFHSIAGVKGVKTILKEKTIPAGDFKARFFQDMLQNGNPSFLLAMRSFYDSGGYVSLPGNIKLLDWLFVTVIGFIAKAFVPPKPTALKRKGEENEVDTSAPSSGRFFG